jgi:hypothetical protein
MDDDVVRARRISTPLGFWGIIPKGPEPHLHRHDFDEFLGFMGGDINAPMELGCEIEIIVDGEAMTLGKTASSSSRPASGTASSR